MPLDCTLVREVDPTAVLQRLQFEDVELAKNLVWLINMVDFSLHIITMKEYRELEDLLSLVKAKVDDDPIKADEQTT